MEEREEWNASLHYSFTNPVQFNFAVLAMLIGEMIRQGYPPRTPLKLMVGANDAGWAHAAESKLPYVTVEVNQGFPDDLRWYVETPDGLRWGTKAL